MPLRRCNDEDAFCMTVWAYVGCGGFVGHHIHLMKQAGRLRLSVYPMYHILHYSHTNLTSWNTSTFKYGVKCNAWMRHFVGQDSSVSVGGVARRRSTYVYRADAHCRTIGCPIGARRSHCQAQGCLPCARSLNIEAANLDGHSRSSSQHWGGDDSLILSR